MEEVISFIYRFLGEDAYLDPVWGFSSEDGSNGMFWGFVLLVLISGLGAFYFYCVYTKYFANRAVRKNWFKYMLYTAIAVFVIQELVLAGIFTAADEEAVTGSYIANLIIADGGKLILFSFINALYSLLVYYLWSLALRYFSKNARYLPHSKK
jgi:hypothetical protein